MQWVCSKQRRNNRVLEALSGTYEYVSLKLPSFLREKTSVFANSPVSVVLTLGHLNCARGIHTIIELFSLNFNPEKILEVFFFCEFAVSVVLTRGSFESCLRNLIPHRYRTILKSPTGNRTTPPPLVVVPYRSTTCVIF